MQKFAPELGVYFLCFLWVRFFDYVKESLEKNPESKLEIQKIPMGKTQLACTDSKVRLHLLSKTERDFANDPYQFPKRKAKKFRYKIRKKLKIVKQDLELLMENCDDIGISPQEVLDMIGLSDGMINRKEILRSPKKETRRFESLSEFENW